MEHTTPGHPCWLELVTPDRDRTAAFYSGLFGWTTTEPVPELGGYSQLQLEGRPLGGLMPEVPGMTGAPGWTVYLATRDAEALARRAEEAGGSVVVAPMALPDLGTMVVVADASGMEHGGWQAGPFAGLDSQERPGDPIWFEAYSRDFTATHDFLRDVFDWTPHLTGDTDEFRYATSDVPETAKAGLMDASGWGEDFAPGWASYIKVSDMDAALTRVAELGGSVTQGPDDTPFGLLAEVADPTGQRVKIMVPPAG
ncbi:VOC family protein [Nocardioides sp. zg-ZUI104]|uniref:VOC family protein n=1 Tax=Nocardioides faecalis TaxID=2803858 RepID=UPI001BD004F2|nr:VOC family protein [Nocardioides faecalis]MBS4752657.1 VOC family protein [Nocardioides faecalis]